MCCLAPHVRMVHIHRVNPTKFNVTVMVEYTGAGPSASLELLNSEFKSIQESMAGWLPLDQHIPLVKDTSDTSLWKTVFVHTSFSAFRIVEFRFSVINNVANGFSVHKLEGVSG